MSSQVRPPARVDVPVAVRGASAGFSVLLIGWLLSTAVAIRYPQAALTFLIAVSIVGFYVAARRVGTATIPALHGTVAALMAYLLVLPITWHFTLPKSPAEVGVTMLSLALALSTGSLTGWMNSHHREQP